MESLYERVKNKNLMWKYIKKAQENKTKVFVWGTGKIGKGVGYEIMKRLNVDIDFYCDSDYKKWDLIIRDNIRCVSPEKMKEFSEIVCFVLVGAHYVIEVCRMLQSMEIDSFVTFEELSTTDVFMKEYFPFMNKPSTAIYTCITGNYDDLIHPQYISEGCDYYLISDRKVESDITYKWININDLLPSNITDNTRRNRYCKIMAHEIFPEYKFSIYVDGNIQITNDINMCLSYLKRTRLAVAGSSYHMCVYVEAMRCIETQKDNCDIIKKQVERYYNEGMPRYFGQFLCNVLVREHNSPVCKQLMTDWWKEVFNESKRDQLSFSYILWKNGFIADDVGMITENPWQDSRYWKYIKGHKN